MPHKTSKDARAAAHKHGLTCSFQLEDQREKLKSDISQYGLTCPSATASYVFDNPTKYGTTASGMCSRNTLERQLGQLSGLVYGYNSRSKGRHEHKGEQQQQQQQQYKGEGRQQHKGGRNEEVPGPFSCACL